MLSLVSLHRWFRNFNLIAPFTSPFLFHSFLHPPAPGETHTSFLFLSTKLPPLHFGFLPLSLATLMIFFFYPSTLSAHFRAKKSIYISEVSVSSILSCWFDSLPVCLHHVSPLPFTETGHGQVFLDRPRTLPPLPPRTKKCR